jgi:hypothetical protein
MPILTRRSDPIEGSGVTVTKQSENADAPVSRKMAAASSRNRLRWHLGLGARFETLKRGFRLPC